MKDILIQGKKIKNEITVWLICFAISIIFNIYAISKYDTAWYEILTQLHIVILLSILFYLIILPVRIVYKFLRKSIGK